MARWAPTFPSPPGLPEFTLGALRLTQAYVGMLVFGPIVVAALAVFLRRSRYGIAIRCASDNTEAARMAGIFAGRMSSLAWALAGIVSAFTAILVLPSRGLATGESFGPSLLLRALTGAVIARMTSLPVALAAGVGLGVVEQLVLWNYPSGGLVQVVLLVIIGAALLLQRGIGGREEEKGSWAAVQSWRPLPEAVARIPRRPAARLDRRLVALVRRASRSPLFISNSSAVTFTHDPGVLDHRPVRRRDHRSRRAAQPRTGRDRRRSAASCRTTSRSRSDSFLLSFVYAGIAAAARLAGDRICPALRIKGLLLAVTTLGFSLVTASWLLQQPWAIGTGVNPTRPTIAGNTLESGRAYYYFVLGHPRGHAAAGEERPGRRARPAAHRRAGQRGQRPGVHGQRPTREAPRVRGRRVHRRDRRRVSRPSRLADNDRRRSPWAPASTSSRWP